jgi:diketogulonate reductase-like aldo/keto reductase
MMRDQWAALTKLYQENKTRAIGVSNFCAQCLECIRTPDAVVPAVNQLL